jgi:hypothetical protein
MPPTLLSFTYYQATFSLNYLQPGIPKETPPPYSSIYDSLNSRYVPFGRAPSGRYHTRLPEYAYSIFFTPLVSHVAS